MNNFFHNFADSQWGRAKDIESGLWRGMPEQWLPKGIFLPGHRDFHQPDESVSIKRIKMALLVYICSICELDELDCFG